MPGYLQKAWFQVRYLINMAKRASLCHLCDVVNQGVITGYVNGRPVYGTSTTQNVSCRFYRMKGPVQDTPSGPHIITQLRLRLPLGTSISDTSSVVGKSSGFGATYQVDGLPEVAYSQKHPKWLECSLRAVD